MTGYDTEEAGLQVSPAVTLADDVGRTSEPVDKQVDNKTKGVSVTIDTNNITKERVPQAGLYGTFWV